LTYIRTYGRNLEATSQFLSIADTFRDGKFEKKICSDEKTAIFLLPYCTYSSLQQLSRNAY
jgi:hypothetical protein